MTRRFKVVAIIITIITLSVSTYCGVLASQKLSGLSLGTIRNYSSLDALDGNVGMVNVLLIGVDDGGYRSDTIMLASLDGYSNRVSILSIPRDTMVTINGTTQKINADYGYSSDDAYCKPFTQTGKEQRAYSGTYPQAFTG